MVRIVKKRPFISFGFAALLIAVGVTGFGLVADAWQGGNGNVLRLRVRNGPGLPPGTFSHTTAISGAGRGAFVVQGKIYAEDDVAETDSIGTFRCWGWNSQAQDIPGYPGANTVSQEFEIDGWGKVQVQGTESPRPADLAIVGGTGHFAGARGVVTLGIGSMGGMTVEMRFLDGRWKNKHRDR